MLNWKAFIILALINTVSVSGFARMHQVPFAKTPSRASEPRALIKFRAAVFKRQVAGTSKGSLPNKDSTTNNDPISKATAARDLLRRAKAAALSIKGGFQRGLILDEIGAAEATAGDLDAAVETANQADPHTYATLGAIGNQLGKSSDLIKAKSIGAKLTGGSSTVFGFMSRRQADDGKIDDAFKAVEQIEAPEVRSDALRWIADRQAANGDYDGMRKTMAMAKTADPTRRSDANEVETLLVAGQLGRGDLQTARATIASIKSPEERFSVMIAFAEAIWKKEDNAAVAAWVKEALKELPAEPRYDSDRYFAIPIQVKIGKKERAMLAAGALSPEFRVKGYNAVAVTCAEAKDTACVNAALQKMKLAARTDDGEKRISNFGLQLMILNVTAALIDHGNFKTASRWIATVEQNRGSSRRFIQASAQLQRVVMLAQQNRFTAARLLALKMRPNSIADVPRGTALRTTALLETRKNGAVSPRNWALSLKDAEDRAYALLGIAQALLDIGEVKLPYAAIQVH